MCDLCIVHIADFTSSLLLHEVVRMIGLFFESFGLLLHTLLDSFDGFRFVRVLEEMCHMDGVKFLGLSDKKVSLFFLHFMANQLGIFVLKTLLVSELLTPVLAGFCDLLSNCNAMHTIFFDKLLLELTFSSLFPNPPGIP